MTTAMVVGSGPNGLAAAVTLARAGLEVTVLEAAEQPGGGTRSAELTVPGVLHDECSGFHPLAVETAFSAIANLDRYGLQWRHPQVQYAQPLDDGTGAAAWQDVATTAEHLGSDGPMWQRVFGPLSENFPEITEDFLQPMLHLPHHVCKLAHFGAFAGMPATLLGKLWHTPQARALFAGVAAHAFRPFGSLASSAIGIALGTAAHTYGWPVAAGGSQAISAAMIAALEDLGGRVETGLRVRSLLDLPPADVVMLDISPAAALEIGGAQIPYPVRCGCGPSGTGPEHSW